MPQNRVGGGKPYAVLGAVMVVVAAVLPLRAGVAVAVVAVVLLASLAYGFVLPGVLPPRLLWIGLLVAIVLLAAVASRIDLTLPMCGFFGVLVGFMFGAAWWSARKAGEPAASSER